MLDLLTHYDLPVEVFEPFYRGDPTYRPEHSWVAESGGGLVAHLRVYERRMRMLGAVVRMGGIGNVVTARQARGGGLAHQLLGAVCEHLDSEYAVSLLWTHVPSLYSAHGWYRVPQEQLIVDTANAAPERTAIAGRVAAEDATISVGADADLPAVLDLHARADAERAGTMLRSLEEWRAQRAWLSEDPRGFLVMRDGTQALHGYIRRTGGAVPRVLEVGAMPGDASTARRLIGAASRTAGRASISLPPSLRHAVNEDDIIERLPSQLMLRICSPRLLADQIGGTLLARTDGAHLEVSLTAGVGAFTMRSDGRHLALGGDTRSSALDGRRSAHLMLYGCGERGPDIDDRPDAASLRRAFPPQDTVIWPSDRF